MLAVFCCNSDGVVDIKSVKSSSKIEISRLESANCFLTDGLHTIFTSFL